MKVKALDEDEPIESCQRSNCHKIDEDNVDAAKGVLPGSDVNEHIVVEQECPLFRSG
jgi:hypothetical protein